jgi:putative hydrolase of the HAD superfamily
MIRAVFFDLDDTLTDDDGSMQFSMERAAAMVCCRRPGLSVAEVVDAYTRESDAVWTAFAREQASGKAAEPNTGYRLRCESWRRGLRLLGVEDEELTQCAVAEYARLREETVYLLPETLDVLQWVRGRFRTAIITNGPTDLQRPKLRRLGLEPLVDHVVISEEFGVGKPNPTIFVHTAKALGVQPTECMMVGDNFGCDICGAHDAGMRSVWIQLDGRTQPVGAREPDYTIHGLRELVGILDGTKG